jgi:DNA (cytosine-5)-methyltransferase 1
MSIKTISLFSGAGGLDIGAIAAGANIVWANDMMKEACESYRQNIGSHIVQGDLNEYLDDLKEFKDVDLVIGGPPCQGFSVAGKMDAYDKRSQLIWSFADVVSITKPRAFVMENVKALGVIERWEAVRNALLRRFREIGYAVNYIVLNASDYNVPQSRERVFFIGFRMDEQVDFDLELMMQPYRCISQTVREALRVLDKAGTGNNSNVCNAKITLAAKPILRKSPYAGMLFNGLGRPTKIDGYSATLPASMGGNKTPIIDEKELYDKAEPWIETYHAMVTKDIDKASFMPAPSFLRRMTPAEAAIIQTFPLEYKFCGTQSKIYTQIGNAVPCNLAKAVVSMVIDVLKGKRHLVLKSTQQEISFK